MDLEKTLDNLKQQDPTLQQSLTTLPVDVAAAAAADSSAADTSMGSIETRGITEVARLVDGLTRAVIAARERVTPLSQKLAPLRLKVTEMKEERDMVKQVRR